MNFSDYAQGLYPFCSAGAGKSVYFLELIGNFVKDAAMDACRILKRKEDTRYRYINGTRGIQSKDAQYIYENRDVDKFSSWLDEQMYESDSFEEVEKWLDNFQISHSQYEISDACSTLFESILLDIIRGDDTTDNKSDDFIYDFALVNEINKKIESLPRPAELPVPEEATPEEHDYICELYYAYGDAEGKDNFSEADLTLFPEYEEDLADRRIDFYAAESIHRGVMEFARGELSGQFDILKNETYDGVKDTAKRTHSNGYERMLAVMEQAVNLNVKNYILSDSPYWISGRIKKGVCQQLADDGRLKWVKKKNE